MLYHRHLFYAGLALLFGAAEPLCAQPFTDTMTEVDTLGMTISDAEKAAIVQAMQYGQQISAAAEKINGKPYRRDAHAKATGCVRATFTINDDIPKQFQHTVFAEPGHQYPAWIRFSNGDMTVQADNKPDARGMAVKVMQVSGDKIAPELAGPATQDFVMANTPAFFHRNVFDYVADMKDLAQLKRTHWFISLWPPRLHAKQFYRAIEAVSSKIDTPLAPQYYSMLPYALGETELKFSSKPCPGAQFTETADHSQPDYLTTVMQAHLQKQSACFQFMVQQRVADKDMPLDDATVIWEESVSPFIAIATIEIPAQTFTGDAQQTFCENLSMNPWHGVGEWQPLGSLNRARRLVYHAVSQYRHSQNRAPVFEPDSWCLEQGEACNTSQFFH
ncbi:catalase family protein [Halioxenophilus sp. WMMB6]|uniref:catalase family protein n=1 Tax=Halioxenophilus sp. WMMB6 TaxID=3073815 RepID=UPI00295EC046|nr:catalase family protein [Halioxenophilus sp. WMMB6]